MHIIIILAWALKQGSLQKTNQNTINNQPPPSEYGDLLPPVSLQTTFEAAMMVTGRSLLLFIQLL